MIRFGRTFSLLLVTLCLCGCVTAAQQWVDMRLGRTNPHAVLTADPVEETWCYRTLAAIECYKAPQRLPPESLVSVHPATHMPKGREAYMAALAAHEGAGKVK